MTTAPKSLLRTLLKSMLLPSMAAILVGTTVSLVTIKEEYDEILDAGLTNKAHLLLGLMEASALDDVFSTSPKISNLLEFEREIFDPDEQTVFWLLRADGSILRKSTLAVDGSYPLDIQEGFITANSFRFRYLKSPSGTGLSIVVGVPSVERDDAIVEFIGGVLVSILALVAAMWFVTVRSVRRSVKSIEKLSENIAEKDEHNLTPIDRRHSFLEIEPAIDTLDELMGRLDRAITAEREFATIAAHELRTPVAICLAHVQRLNATLVDAAAKEKAAAIEKGLKRLTKLIERLLQLSRAQSGLGTNAESSDLNEVTKLLLAEFKDRLPDGIEIKILMPSGRYESYISPDAFGIVLNNLLDNALKYNDGPDGIAVDAGTSGEISVSNDCDPLTADEIDKIKERFGRKSNLADGYGLGLSIVQALCEQTGSYLEILSPVDGSSRGFRAILKLP